MVKKQGQTTRNNLPERARLERRPSWTNQRQSNSYRGVYLELGLERKGFPCGYPDVALLLLSITSARRSLPETSGGGPQIPFYPIMHLLFSIRNWYDSMTISPTVLPFLGESLPVLDVFMCFHLPSPQLLRYALLVDLPSIATFQTSTVQTLISIIFPLDRFP